MEAGIDGRLVSGFAGGGDAQGVVQELVGAAGGLLGVAFLERFREFQQGFQPAGLGHDEVSQVAGKGPYEVQGVEALRQNLVQGEESVSVVSAQEIIHHPETVFVVQDVEVADDVFVMDIGAAEGHRLVENGEGVAHGSIGLGSDYMEGFVVDGDSFLGGDAAKVPHHVRNADAVEVVGLAAAQDGGKNLVFLRCRQNEDGVCRGLFQRLEEGVEGGLGQHVDLIDDVHAVASDLRGHLYLFHERFDVFHGVVGSGIQFVDAVRAAFLETHARFALPAGLHFRPGVHAIDHFGENARRGGLAHAPRTAEQIGMRQLPPPDGVGQRPGNRVLADQGFEGIRPVLPGRYNIVAHRLQR